jgi:hypothetical protein
MERDKRKQLGGGRAVTFAPMAVEREKERLVRSDGAGQTVQRQCRCASSVPLLLLYRLFPACFFDAFTISESGLIDFWPLRTTADVAVDARLMADILSRENAEEGANVLIFTLCPPHPQIF